MTKEEAIEELKILKEDYWDDDGYGHETKQYDDTMLALDMAIKALEQEPSSSENPNRWIPCSERLPEDMTYVLTTIQINSKRVRVRSGNYYHGFFNNDNGDVWNATDEEVTAWMPLPEPYKAESEE